MVEFVTDAIVLGKRISGERDSLVSLFTPRDGVVPTLVAAGTNITSKLTPYLNTLSYVTARIVGKNNYRLAGVMEARESCRTEQPSLPELLRAAHLMRELLPPFVPEPALWDFFRGAVLGGDSRPATDPTGEVLRRLGYDPQFASCCICGAPASVFAADDATFYCNIHGKTHARETTSYPFRSDSGHHRP